MVAPAGKRPASRGSPSTPQSWPAVDPTAVVEATREVPIQVNGKLRDRVTVPAGISEIELEQIVLARDRVRAALDGREPLQGHPRGRRQARQHRRSPGRVMANLDPLASDPTIEADFAKLLADKAPDVAATARAVRAAVKAALPDAVEQIDFGNGLLALGRSRAMRDLLFAIIPHRAHVNLQLADGANLPNPDGLDRGHREAHPPRQGAVCRGRRFATAEGGDRRADSPRSLMAGIAR